MRISSSGAAAVGGHVALTVNISEVPLLLPPLLNQSLNVFNIKSLRTLCPMRWVVLASFEIYGKKPQKVKYFA